MNSAAANLASGYAIPDWETHPNDTDVVESIMEIWIHSPFLISWCPVVNYNLHVISYIM